jgi:hypothetical protein
MPLRTSQQRRRETITHSPLTVALPVRWRVSLPLAFQNEVQLSSRDCHVATYPPTPSPGNRTLVRRGLKNAAGSVKSVV